MKHREEQIDWLCERKIIDYVLQKKLVTRISQMECLRDISMRKTHDKKLKSDYNFVLVEKGKVYWNIY